MKILALEFSSEQRSAALASAQEGRCDLLASASETGGRSTRAIALIEKILAEAAVDREEINCIAVGIGPGSYTGIRAAIALVQGWELATGIKVLGISSVECLAAQAQIHGWHGAVNIVVDAQRNEFYLAGYYIRAEALTEVEALHITSHEKVCEMSAGRRLLGPDADRFRDGIKVFPEAGTLARIACHRSNYISAASLEPIYLRETNFIKAPPARVI